MPAELSTSSRPTSPPARAWTGPQRRAISHGVGDLLVSAAAGSGKTAVLAERCARLVCGENPTDRPCGVENLLVVTFTEAAANEMRTRIAEALRQKLRSPAPGSDPAWLRRQAAMVDRASISTLHGFCARVLRAHFHEIGLDPAFEVIDEDEAGLLREEVLDDLLARWHQRTDARGKQFAEFLEAYAQGREGTLRGMILQVHDMLASVPDRAAYKARARAAYGAEPALDGACAADTLDQYARRCLGGQLRVAAAAARRACGQVAGNLGIERMLVGLEEAAQVIEGAHRLICAEGVARWGQVRGMLEHRMPTLRNIRIEGFEELRKRTWDGIKKTLDKLHKAFAPDPAAMLEDLRAIGAPGGPLETLLWMAEEFDAAFSAAKRGGAPGATGSHAARAGEASNVASNESGGGTSARGEGGAGGARLDFHDLERLTCELLVRDPNAENAGNPGGGTSHAARELRQRYHHILVDEFQDINPLQYALLTAIRNDIDGRGNLFVVGDAKQSIYGFRLAEPELFLGLEHRWRQPAGTSDGLPGRCVSLPHNFRSQAPLIDVMNGVFGRLLTPEVVGIDYWGVDDRESSEAHREGMWGTGEGGGADGGGHALVAGRARAALPPSSSPPASPRPLDGAPVEMHLVVMDRTPELNGEGEEDDSSDSAENLSALEHEAQIVAERIAQLVAEEGGRGIAENDGTVRPIQYRDIAILLRSMKSKAMVFARALEKRGIPAHAELSTGYFDTPEVRDTLALLQVLDNPKLDIPLATVMLGPYGGFAHDDLARIRLAYDRKEVPFAEAAGRYAADGEVARLGLDLAAEGDARASQEWTGIGFDHDLGDRLSAFYAKLGRWREKLLARPLHEGLAEIFAESNIFACLAGLEGGGGGSGGSGGGGESGQRIANLQMLHQRALKFAGFRKQGLHRFLRFIERLRDQEGDYGEAPVLSEASQVVRIMSVHKSKGLEFPVVFVSGLGGKLKLSGESLVMTHRDLGIGLAVADVERNVFYPSAAALRIADAEARSNRAEELRLLYVALTRARDHLVLTGHVARSAALDGWREAWRSHQGPLPEDVLLKGATGLDWLVQALACGGPCGKEPLSVSWCDGEESAGDAQVQVTLHAPAAARRPAPLTEDVHDRVQRIIAGEPLTDSSVSAAPEAEAASPAIRRMMQRISGQYPYAGIAAQPAVRTVTALKTIAEDLRADEMGETIDEFPGEVEETPGDPAAAERARMRGIATHRILELLDFTDCATEEALERQIDRMVERKALTTEERAVANLAGIRWFLWHSHAGRRMIAALRTPPPGLRLRRELAFTWAAPLVRTAESSGKDADPADWPTIRGVIDLLLADPARRTAEILDYKTDSLRLWESRLPDYRRQMRYYLQAASEILGYPVPKATLLFLSAQEEREVTLDPPL